MDKGTGIIVIGNADISPFIIGHTVFETNSPIEVVEGVDIFGTRELPPLKEIQLVKGVKGGSKILCRTKDGNPLIVKNGQIIGIAANDVWRWNFEYGIKFWSQLVKLINAQGQTLFVETEPVFEIGERVIFKAQAYLSDGLPNPNEDIKIKVSDNEAISTNSTNIEGHFYSLSNGKYEYAVEFLPPGKYKYSCSTINNSTSNGEFSIISQIELQKIESDYNLLHTIAEVSSGKYVEDIKELDSIAINFTLPQKSKLPFKPSYSYLSLFLIILLLSIEWAYLRK
ncbi:MAG: hypothetical protein HY769_07365 [Candidatus Stahlbacteria bacterium]|nr:hypothetical protein [Candidatus Stahlbacteria bacterium]